MDIKGNKIKKIISILLVMASAVGIVAILLYKNNWIYCLDGDIAGYIYGPINIVIKSLYETGEIPRWIPNIWGGISLFHSLSKSFSITTLLLGMIYYMPEVGLVSFGILEAIVVFHTVLLIVGCYVFICSLGFHKKVALFASFVVTINGYFFSCYFGQNAYNNVAWIPWLLFALFESWKTERKMANRYTILAGLIAAQFLLFHFAQSSVMILVIWFLFFSWYLWGNRFNKKEMIKVVVKCILSGVIGVGLAAILILPTMELSSISYRYVPDIGFMKSGDLYPISALMSDIIDTVSYSGIGKEGIGYFSISSITMITIIAGFFSKQIDEKKRSILRFGQFVIVFTVLTSFAFFFVDFLYYIPFVNQVRQPRVFLLVLFIGVVIVSAFGLESMLDIQKPWRERFYNVPLLWGLLISIIVLDLLPHNVAIMSVSSLVLFLVFIIIHYIKNLPKQVVSFFSIFLIGVMAVQSAYSLRISFNKAYTSEEAHDKAVIVQESVQQIFEAIETPSGESPFRITKYGSESWSADILMHIGGYDIDGYWNPIYGKTVEKHMNMNEQKRMILENVRYWCVSSESAPEFLDWIETAFNAEKIAEVSDVYGNYDATETNDILIYEMNSSLGGAWFINDIQYYPKEASDAEILQLINDDNFDVSTTALVSEAEQINVNGIVPVQSAGEMQTVQFTEYNYNTIRLTCSTGVKSLLVFAESDAPGWKAYVDGKQVEIFTADYDRKALVIEPGVHEVELVYSPTSFEIGRVISIGTSLAIVVYLMISIIQKLRSKRMKTD